MAGDVITHLFCKLKTVALLGGLKEAALSGVFWIQIRWLHSSSGSKDDY
jgi:hypothetical protein